MQVKRTHWLDSRDGEAEIREELMEVVSRQGGELGSTSEPIIELELCRAVTRRLR